ncbi:MAG: DeoR/GlpR family DNA-binding transcription regulator [bacterium]|jgi:DeoR family fructose operon transcriptional repressor
MSTLNHDSSATISAEAKDLAIGRIEKMRRILKDRRIVRVDELTGELGVSAATVRRDLLHMENRGELRRVHGGAVAPESRLEEPLFDDKTSIAAAEKRRIAEAALRLVRPKDSIFLDGGSTVLALASLLHDRSDITVVTNSLRVAAEFAGGGPMLIVIGGELRRLSQTFVGPLTRFTLESIHVDRAFMGTIGITAGTGLTTTDPREAYTKSLIMDHAQEVVLLADSSKIGKVSFARFGALDKVGTLITDKGLAENAARDLRKQGIKTVIV